MTMQARRSEVEADELGIASGTFPTELPRDVISEAHDLARQIEELLAHTADDAEPYGRRLARALAQSLIDQLADLSRDRKRAKVA